jgi:hypothetical protein
MAIRIKTAESLYAGIISNLDFISKQAEEEANPKVAEEQKDVNALPSAEELSKALEKEANKSEVVTEEKKAEEVVEEESAPAKETTDVTPELDKEKGKKEEEATVPPVAATDTETKEAEEVPLTEDEKKAVAEAIAAEATGKEVKKEEAAGLNPALPIKEEDVVKEEEGIPASLTAKEASDLMLNVVKKRVNANLVSMQKEAGVPILKLLKQVSPGIISGGIGGAAGFHFGAQNEEKKDEVEDNMIYNVGIRNGAVAMAKAISDQINSATGVQTKNEEIPGGNDVQK